MTRPNRRCELTIENCWFKDEIRLADLADGPALIFKQCVFEKGLIAREAKLDRSLTLERCVVKGNQFGRAIDLENARIGGNLILDECTLAGSFHAPGLRADNNVQLYECRIGESLLSLVDSMSVREIENWSEPLDFDKKPFKLTMAIDLSQAVIARDLHIRSKGLSTDSVATVIYGNVMADQAEIGGNVYLMGMFCVGNISFHGVEVKGNVSTSSHVLTDNAAHFRATGSLTFRDSVIDQNLSLSHATVDGEVSLYRAAIGGNVDLLGLKTEGDLNLAFVTVGAFVAAFRHATNPGTLRPTLSVRGDLSLSGAQIQVVELRGVDIHGHVIVITGKFGRLTLSLGVEPIDGPVRSFYVKASTASSVRMSAINVDQDLDVSGVQVTVTSDQREQERERMLYEGGIVLTQCSVGRDLKFFLDEVQAVLERRWTEAVRWSAVPETWKYRAYTWGNLVLRANKIGGNLDLRNVEVEGDLYLNDTTVTLDLNVDAGHPIYEGFKTQCRNFDAEKLECGGDAKLTGLEVKNNFKARAAKVRGDLLFLPRERKKRRVFFPSHAYDGESPVEADSSSAPQDYAAIGGDVDLTAVTTNHLVLSGANLRKRGGAEAKARISLERVMVGRLEIVTPPILGTVNLAGVSVHRWAFGDPNRNETLEPTVASYIEVLSENKPFDRATWIEVETALRNEARDGDANRVYREMRKRARSERPVFRQNVTWGRYFRTELRRLRQLRRRPKKWLRSKRREASQTIRLMFWHLWDRLQFVAIGYGTRVWLPMIPTVILFALSLLIFTHAEYVRASPALLQVLGTNSAAQTSPATFSSATVSPNEPRLNVCPDHNEWGVLDALALTLRYHVPIVSSMTHQEWEAGTKQLPVVGISAERYALLVEIYHWMAWPLFLVAAAALVFRGRQK